MADDYVPAPDADFDSWQVNCVTFAAAIAAALGPDRPVDIAANQAVHSTALSKSPRERSPPARLASPQCPPSPKTVGCMGTGPSTVEAWQVPSCQSAFVSRTENH